MPFYFISCPLHSSAIMSFYDSSAILIVHSGVKLYFKKSSNLKSIHTIAHFSYTNNYTCDSHNIKNKTVNKHSPISISPSIPLPPLSPISSLPPLSISISPPLPVPVSTSSVSLPFFPVIVLFVIRWWLVHVEGRWLGHVEARWRFC